jgi:superfamily II DNA or RNA helicase
LLRGQGLKTFSEIIDGFPSTVGHRGRLFEELSAWWLVNDPTWSRKIDRVWLWEEFPEADGPDVGIDLVALVGDEYWAVQCKCVDSESQIPKKQLDSFLSASAGKKYAGRILIGTTDRLSANARRTLTELGTVFVGLTELQSSYVSWEDWVSRGKSVREPASPRPHQERALKDVLDGFDGHSRGQMIMACGTGKSLTSLWVYEALDPQTAIVFVPSISLLGQILRTWAANSNHDWEYLAVCSDSTVDERVDSLTDGALDLGLPATTEIDSIEDFLRKPVKKVLFSTYQSAGRVTEARRRASSAVDLVVFDEAHRIAGNSSSWGAEILHDDGLPAQRRLFMTATPRTFNPAAKAKADAAGVSLVSMDDEALFGPVFHNLTFSFAIENNLLSDYRVIILGTHQDEVESLLADDAFLKVGDSNIEARTLAAHVTLSKSRVEFGLAKTITFHSSILKARRFAEFHSVVGESLGSKVKADFVSGEMPSSQRSRKISQLAEATISSPRLLSNARCLTEGIDLPALDAIAFVDPKGSQTDIVQAVGRAIRKSPEKSFGYIVIPVVVESKGGRPEIPDGQFQTIWSVINALRAHDSAFADELDAARRAVGREGTARPPEKLEIRLPDAVYEDVEEFAAEVFTRLLERTSSGWEFMFGQLEAYVEEEGKATPPNNLVRSGFQLGKWVSRNRSLFREESDLNLEERQRRNLLAELPGWSWDPVDDFWEQRFSLLQEYAKEFGHARPSNNELYRGDNLGRFVGTQRYRFNTGQLSPERASRLEGLSKWAWSKYDGEWLDYFGELESFVQSNGRMPSADENRSLYWWTHTQRKHRDSLDQWKIQKLEELNVWRWTKEDKWMDNYRSVQAILATREDVVFDISSHIKDPVLRNWYSSQRTKATNQRLPQDRAQLWKELDLVANPIEARWDDGFLALEKFIRENGNWDVPNDTLTQGGKKLAPWLTRQAFLAQKGSLPKLHEDRLRSLGWEPFNRRARWDDMLQSLRSYSQTNGHIYLSAADDEALFEWMRVQCRRYEAGTIDPTYVLKLESVGGWSWNRFMRSFDFAIEIFKDYRVMEPVEWPARNTQHKGFPLGLWAFQMRKMHGWGKLSSGDIRKLEDLPNWKWGSR